MLEEIWKELEKDIPKEGGVSHEAKAQEFLFPWNHDQSNMEMIRRFMRIARPLVVVELGTFEALGTLEIAKVLNKTAGSEDLCYLFTTDLGKEPISLGPTYGVPKSKKSVNDWQKRPGWNTFDKVIEARKERFEEIVQFPNVELLYLEGWTKFTVPRINELLSSEDMAWDFCFHDASHDFRVQKLDFNNLKKSSRVGSVIVFDDVVLPSKLYNYFLDKENDWDLFHTQIGRQQLWAERIR